MGDWIYCATDDQVDAAGTRRLLREMKAIWCPPPGLRPWPRQHPDAGDRVWLVWRRREDDGPVKLLGTGLLQANDEERFNTRLLWTHGDLPGAVDLAESLGYRGGRGMSFLVLDGVRTPEAPPEVDLGDVKPRFNEAADGQREVLADHLSPES